MLCIALTMGSLMISSFVSEQQHTTFPTLHIIMYEELHRHEWRNATASVTGENWRFNFEPESISIRGRGNSTWNLVDKRPFRIRFDEPREMLSSGHRARNWTLISNHNDFSLMRNYSVYFFAGLLDGMNVAPWAQFVHVYFNGEYKGVYMMSIQKSEMAYGRVNLTSHLFLRTASS